MFTVILQILQAFNNHNLSVATKLEFGICSIKFKIVSVIIGVFQLCLSFSSPYTETIFHMLFHHIFKKLREEQRKYK